MTALTGTGQLIRLALRRDRVVLPLWILVIAGLVVATASGIADLYPHQQDRIALGVTIGTNPALRVITGPVFDSASVGGLTAWRVSSVAGTLTALMSILVITRHTRAEEETGRSELIGSAAVGRGAPPMAAVAVVAGANVVLALGIATGLMGQGLPAAGAFALGIAIGGTGWVFAGVAVLAAQLTESSRTANGLAIAALGVAFAVRAAGDALAKPALPWLSPLGWIPQTRAFAGERWWVPSLAVALTGALLLVAGWFARDRDLGAGLLRPRLGPATAAARLSNPVALAWRLHRGMLAGWVAGFAVGGAVLGGLAEGIGNVVADNPQLAGLLEAFGGQAAITDTFFAAEMSLLGLIAAGYAVQATLRLRAEEVGMRAEPVLATAVSRWQWMASHLAVALFGATVMLAAVGVTAGLTYGLTIGEPVLQTVRLLGAALAQAPAAWTLAGVATALFGLAPRRTALTWAAPLACLLLGQLGDLLRIDQRLQNLSPFVHVPPVPANEVPLPPLLALAAVTAGLAIVGMIGFQRRDLTGH